MKSYELYNNFNITFETPNDGYSYFFGYYDKSPINRKGDKLLAHRVSFDGRPVCDNDIAEVGYFDLDTNIFHKIDETLAWNWQQGSNLQWMPPNYDRKIIYNSIRSGKFVSIIYDLEFQTQKVISFPVYVIHPGGKMALGVNYERLYFCRPGYNYQNIKNKKWDVPVHPEDGIFKIDLENDEAKLIINTKQIVSINKNDEMLNSNNWLEHMMFNGNGERFLFFHRWKHNNSDQSRFYTADLDGREIVQYPDCRFYSHYDWTNDDRLIVWTHKPDSNVNYKDRSKKTYLASFITGNQVLKRILKPVYHFTKRFFSFYNSEPSYLICFKDKSLTYKVLGENLLAGNGHTTSINDRYLLSDTYQDDSIYRHLFIFDIIKNEKINIGKFYSLYNDCTFRCDLHPRLSLNKKNVIIDSAHSEKRKMLIINIEEFDNEFNR